MDESIKKILEKKTIVSTASAYNIVENPKFWENYYSEIADTHMSLGDTEEVCKRIVKCIGINKGTFNGAVVGEYGFGKTSLLIYLWKHCLDNSIIAVPPYQWSKFSDHFQVIFRWIRYKLDFLSPEVVSKFEKLFEQQISPTINAKAQKWSQDANISIEQAKKIIELEIKNGKLDLDLTPDDLMSFCSKVSEFLLKHTDWKGLIVITDELQQTISELNRNIVYDYLFGITNHLAGANGNYGFLWGFPSNTHADLGISRGDILDRLNSNGSFVRLWELYDKNFPVYLWEKFCNVYKIDKSQYPIVDHHTLLSIGQVCDGERRDIGNGPRSVISAFKVMVQHYINSHQTYKVNDFIDDCLSKEIKLGEISNFRQRVLSILELPEIGNKYEFIIKLIAGFPSGIPKKTIEDYGIADKLPDLIKETGGLGRVVIKNISLYMLKVLKPENKDEDDTAIQYEIRNFFGEFSPDSNYAPIAHKSFDETFLKRVFLNFKSSHHFERWKIESEYKSNNIHYFNIIGSFDHRFPERKVTIVTSFSTIKFEQLNKLDNHLTFCFVLNSPKLKNKIERIKKDTYVFYLDLYCKDEDLGNQHINEIIPEEKHSPYLFLSLIDYLKFAKIPTTEEPAKDHLNQKLEENIIYNLFNENLLGEIENTNIEIDCQGDHLIRDIFKYSCEELFQQYNTLIRGRGWKTKVQAYVNALNTSNDDLSLMVKRGKEILYWDKNKIAGLFTQSPTNLEAWLVSISNLIEYKFSGESFLKFKPHDLELYVVDRIIKNGKTKNIDGTLCKFMEFNENTIKDFNELGYLNDEILLILQIGQARKYFNFDDKQHIIYQKPEDKDELKNECHNFIKIVEEQIESLCIFNDYENKIDTLKELENQIDSIETTEQADKLKNNLKIIQSYNKYYCEKEIEKLIRIDLINEKGLIEKKSIDIKNIEKKCHDLEASIKGSAIWAEHLIRIRVNILNELKMYQSKLDPTNNKISKMLKTQHFKGVPIIKQFVDLKNEFNIISESLRSEIGQPFSFLEEKYKFLSKWIDVLNLRDKAIKDYYRFSSILGDTLQTNFNTIDDSIQIEFRDNQNNTLKNCEHYNSEFFDIHKNIKELVLSLKDAWLSEQRDYDAQINKITGTPSNWRLRWETPEQAYNDLYELVRNDCQRTLDKIQTNLIVLENDIAYTKDVLNHGTAIKNKGIDNDLEEIKDKIKKYDNSVLDDIIRSKKEFTEFIDCIGKINEKYIDIIREHRKIIKPSPIIDPKEKLVFDKIDKQEGIDLKHLIIEFQNSIENVDLKESRDLVLEIVKELFIKKQITLQVKKGKL